jgi:hypothetical protein
MGMKHYFLSVSEREELKQQKKELENTLREAEEWGKGTQAESLDKSRINKEIKFLEKALRASIPGNISSAQKDKLYKEMGELEEQIKEGMPTYDEMWMPEKNPGVVMKHYQWERKNAQKIDRWKQINRALDPLNPTISSIERLRRKGGN